MYRPKFRPQYPDPTTTLDWSNCTMASGAMALDFHTQGKVQKWGGELRKLQGDQVGGTDIGDLSTAWSKLGYTLTDRRGKTWGDAIVDLKNGRGVVLQGDYDIFRGADSCQSTFDGDHAIYLNPEFFDGSTIAVGDPLCSGFKRITISELKEYAEKLGKKVYGDNRILYATTRAWPDPVVPPKPPVPVPPAGDDMPAFTAPLKPTDVKVKGKSWLYVQPDFDADPKNVQISADRWMPLVGKTATSAIVSYVGSDGKNTGKTYYAKPADLIAERSPVVDCAQAVTAAVAAAKAPLTLENTTLKATNTKLVADVAARDARITAIKAKTAANNADIQND